MDEQKPEIQKGFLGPQEKFNELGLSAMSHPKPEITTRDNHMEIKLQAKSRLKYTYQLINCRTGEDVSQYVFAQMKDSVIHYLVHMPESDYYKLQLYALPAADPSDSLPNVYNYLIRCTRFANPSFPFPKQFAKWKEGCYLHEPMVLHPNSKLTNINWRVIIPHAKAVAVLVGEEWFQFERKGGPQWQATISLDAWRGQDTKVVVAANLEGEDSTQFSQLLEYHI